MQVYNLLPLYQSSFVIFVVGFIFFFNILYVLNVLKEMDGIINLFWSHLAKVSYESTEVNIYCHCHAQNVWSS